MSGAAEDKGDVLFQSEVKQALTLFKLLALQDAVHVIDYGTSSASFPSIASASPDCSNNCLEFVLSVYIMLDSSPIIILQPGIFYFNKSIIKDTCIGSVVNG